MDEQTTPVPAEYIAAYEKLGFGLFVHWGLYSLLGQGEWTMHSHRIPKQEYEQLAKRFTAERFDGRALAQLAKRAGMRYIVLTTRHHDGFSLYDTKGLNTYDAPHSAAKRDLVAEFVEGCRHEGIVPFFYHTTLDWHNELFASDFDAYLEYLNRSVEVLCTQYGKIGGIWFDGNWSKPDADWKLDALYGAIRRRQPEAVIVNNTGLDARGRVGHPEIDVVTFEQGRPTPLDRRGHAKYVAAEMCQTMNGHWGFGRHDFCYQSVGALLETLCACRSAGANYLLNIGPDGDGGVPKLQEATLEMLGEWCRIFGASIYETKPCGVRGTGKDFALQAPDGALYFFIHDLHTAGDIHVAAGPAGEGPRAFTGVAGKAVRSLRWLDSGEALPFSHSAENGLLTLYASASAYGHQYAVRVAIAELK